MRPALIIMSVLILSPLAAGAETWIVDPGGGGDFETIQAAIDAAQNGDDVLVNPGTYVENISFLGKDLIVSSAAGLEVTTIDGSSGPPGNASCVRMVSGEPATATLQGFTITGGTGTDHAGYIEGGGVLCSSSSATIRDCLIVSNTAYNGGGLRSYYGTVEVDNCTFIDNHAAMDVAP